MDTTDIELQDFAIEDVHSTKQRSGTPRNDSPRSDVVFPEEGDDEYTSHDSEPTGGNSTKFGAYVNFVNSIVGAGIIGLANGVAECGFYSGVILMLFVGYLTYVGVQTIIQSGLKVRVKSYEDLCSYTMGRAGYNLVSAFMLIFAFGGMCAYLIIIGDTLPRVISFVTHGEVNRRLVIAIVAIVAILPLCLLKDMAMLSRTSTLSVIAAASITLIVAFYGPTSIAIEQANNPNASTYTPYFSFVEPNLPAGLGEISFAYTCQHSSFIVFNSLKKPTQAEWTIVSKLSLATTVVLSLLISIGGYLIFFQDTLSDILENFPHTDPWINFARLMLDLTMIFTFPMENFVARHSFIVLCFGTSKHTNKQHYGVSLLLWGMSFLVAMFVEDLRFVLQLTGAFSASMLGYILPAAIYFKLNPFRGTLNAVRRAWRPSSEGYIESLWARLKFTNDFTIQVFMFFFGVVAMITGTANAFASQFSNDP